MFDRDELLAGRGIFSTILGELELVGSASLIRMEDLAVFTEP
jgi:hypothetical protein